MTPEETESLRARIEDSWSGEPDRAAIDEVLFALDAGELRVATPPSDEDGDWEVHAWLMKAVLLYFRVAEMRVHEVGPYTFHDKIPLKRHLDEQKVRLVPPGHIRFGAHVEPCVIMLGYVNIGARVGWGRWWTRGRRSAAAPRSEGCPSRWRRGNRRGVEPPEHVRSSSRMVPSSARAPWSSKVCAWAARRSWARTSR